ncbi:MAG: Sua5/YciO/YrdC/YwlC family protein, partial [Salana multivorans]|nr:Sua5/YciO/YrdC/YwlC family protein [Salana multivorans]
MTVLPCDPDQLDASLEVAAATVRGGGLVVLPTDTVYGIGADAFDASAV